MDFHFLSKHKPLPGLCCIYLLSETFIITQAINQGSQIILRFFEEVPYRVASLTATLAELVKKHQLQGVSCSWVLHPRYYQLLLLDPPAVAAGEIALALRWQIKDFVNFPPQEAMVQYFPSKARSEPTDKIYVVAAQQSRLQSIADAVCAAGLKLKFIDIPELALRNINALYCDKDSYLGLVVVGGKDKVGHIVITHQKNMLLMRNLAAMTEPTSAESISEHLLDDIQRSFDFCQTDIDTSMRRKLLLSSDVENLEAVLSERLNIEVSSLALEKKLGCEFLLPPYFSHNDLIAIGGALRESVNYAAS